MADKLIERGLVREPLDLFELKLEPLAKLNLGTDEAPRTFGEKNATKAIQAIERARTFPLSRWLFALGIREVGKTTAARSGGVSRRSRSRRDSADAARRASIITAALREKRTRRCGQNPDAIDRTGFAEKSKSEKQTGIVTEVGPVVAEAVLDFFASEAVKNILRRIKQLGIKPKSEMISTKDAAKLPFAGKTLSSPARCHR